MVNTADSEFRGLGELSPLEEFSTETLAEAKDNFNAAASLLSGQPIGTTFRDITSMLDELHHHRPLLPSVRWCLEMLLCDLAAEVRSLPLCELLHQQPRKHIPIYGLLGGTLRRMLEELCHKVGYGYPVYKIKIHPQRLDDQLQTLAELRRHLDKNILLRLDCNQGLTPDAAAVFLQKAARLGVEYVEEPLQAPTPESLLRLQEISQVPIALDESLIEQSRCNELLDADCFNVMVLKPMLVGGIAASLLKAREAETRGLQLVFSSTLESAIGLAAGLHTAAATGASLLPCGFDTARLFSEQLDELPFHVLDGKMTIPERPGLGVVLKQNEQFGRIANSRSH